MTHRTFTLEPEKAGRGLPRKKVVVALDRAGFRESKHGWTWESPQEYLFLDARLGKKSEKVVGIVLSTPRVAVGDDECLRSKAAEIAGLIDWRVRDDDSGAWMPVRTRCTIALERIDEEKYEEAISLFREAVELEDANLQGWHGLGVAYERSERWKEAIPCFRRAVELEGGVETWAGLANALGETGDHVQSVAVLRKALAKWKKNARLLTSLASEYTDDESRGAKRFAEGLKILREAIAADETYALAWTNAAYSLNMMGRHEEAETMARKAMDLDPEDAFMVYNLACTVCQRKDAERALELLERAIRMDPEIKEQAPAEPELSWLHEDPRFKRLCS